MYFQNYGLQKTWLEKCLKNPVSKDPLTGNIANELKHCWNPHDSTIIRSINHCEGIYVRESLL